MYDYVVIVVVGSGPAVRILGNIAAPPTSSPGRFSLVLGAGREKALASAGHMTTKHPAFVGVIN